MTTMSLASFIRHRRVQVPLKPEPKVITLRKKRNVAFAPLFLSLVSLSSSIWWVVVLIWLLVVSNSLGAGREFASESYFLVFWFELENFQMTNWLIGLEGRLRRHGFPPCIN